MSANAHHIQQALEADIERVASETAIRHASAEHGSVLLCVQTLGGDTLRIESPQAESANALAKRVAAMLGVGRVQLCTEGGVLEGEATLRENGLADGEQLCAVAVPETGRELVERIVEEILALHPHADRERLLRGIKFDDDDEVTEWNLGRNQLQALPESFGQLHVGGDLGLGRNQLQALPESFGQLHVVGNLYLGDNQLQALPESFGQLHVGGDLHLSSNQLQALPESFGQLRVGGDLGLGRNQLQALPESVGQLHVGGDLHLRYNQLQALPESFGQLHVGGNLGLDGNQLQALPESFGQLRVGGNLYLDSDLRGNGRIPQEGRVSFA